MNYFNAAGIIEFQERNLRKVNGTRFIKDGFEYRLSYRGGLAEYVAIDRRPIGKRNFKYFGGLGAYNCLTVGQVMERVNGIIEQKVC